MPMDANDQNFLRSELHELQETLFDIRNTLRDMLALMAKQAKGAK